MLGRDILLSEVESKLCLHPLARVRLFSSFAAPFRHCTCLHLSPSHLATWQERPYYNTKGTEGTEWSGVTPGLSITQPLSSDWPILMDLLLIFKEEDGSCTRQQMAASLELQKPFKYRAI